MTDILEQSLEVTPSTEEETPLPIAEELEGAGAAPGEDAAPAEDTPSADAPPVPDAPDYAALADADLAELRRLEPRYATLTHIGLLPHAARYAVLREAGLSVAEAFYASHYADLAIPRAENRAHLRPAAPAATASAATAMPAQELAAARELFSSLSTAQIQALWRRAKS